MITRIVLLSDLHIRNHSRHDEYREYFNLLENKLNELQPDIIVFGGDLAHSKTNLSPDYFELAHEFLTILGQNGRLVYIIPGNHDCSEHNLSKMDAISPLMKYFNDNYIFLKRSEDCESINNIIFRSYSLLDKENWRFDRGNIRNDQTLIGLYHGPLKNAVTDLGFIFDQAEDWKKFEQLDFLWCGDIHNHFCYDDNDKFISIGNPIQQDFGENVNKGIICYDIYDKNQYVKTYIPIDSLYPYLKLNIDDPIPSNWTDVMYKNARVKIISDKSIQYTQDKIRQIKNFFLTKGGPKAFVLLNKPFQEEISKSKKSAIISFSEFINDKLNKNELLNLHSHYLQQIEYSNFASNWKIKKLEWSNLFSYGESNSLNFESFENQSLGVFGANYSGKCVDPETEIEIEINEDEVLEKLGYIPDYLK